MEAWNRIKTAWNALVRPTADLGDEKILEFLGIQGADKKLTSEVTYFTCRKMLSETMGKMPLKYYQETVKGKIRADPTNVTRLLTIRPNSCMTPTTMWTTVELNCQDYGNGFIWMRSRFRQTKYGGEYEVLDLWPLQSKYVQVLMDDVGVFGEKGNLYYQYSDPKTGQQYLFKDYEIMHFKTWYSLDGIMGLSVKDILKTTVKGSLESQNVMNALYEQGLSASMVLQYTGDLEDGRHRKMQKKIDEYLNGPRNAGKVVAIPAGLQLQPLEMKLADAQFFELRKYSALQIAGAFGIKPNQINDYEKSSYANSETQQLAFLIDTMLYRLKMYEEEINEKALTLKEQMKGYFYKFNEKVILRADSKTQMQMMKDGVQNAIYKPNEAREYLDMPWDEDGDVLVANGNFIPLKMVGEQYKKEGDNNVSTQPTE